jgi:hypothetical protein
MAQGGLKKGGLGLRDGDLFAHRACQITSGRLENLKTAGSTSLLYTPQ